MCVLFFDLKQLDVIVPQTLESGSSSLSADFPIAAMAA